MMSGPVGPALLERTPEILECSRNMSQYMGLRRGTDFVLAYGQAVDPSFLKIFTFPLISGSINQALSAPNSLVLTQKTAATLFGDQNPIGQTLDNGLVVTAIIEDVPRNSSIDFDFLVTLAFAQSEGWTELDNWYDHGFDTYVLLDDNADPETVGQKIKNTYIDADADRNDLLLLQSLGDIHLKKLGGGGRIVYVYVFSSVALLLLLVACVNFINLSTARASERAREIGLRKTVGASRSQLARQMLTEAALQTLVALSFAICLVELILPSFQDLSGKPLSLEFSTPVVLLLLATTLVTALGAGMYPAMVLSSFRPVAIFRKSGSGAVQGKNLLRRSLVVVQFAISTGLIFCAIAIHNQLNLINSKDLGISKDNIVVIRAEGLESDYQVIKNELARLPGVLGVAGAFQPPTSCDWYVADFDFEGRRDDQPVRSGVAWVDADYLDVFGLEVIEGRTFSKEFGTDESTAYLVNEAAVRLMEIDEPVGKSLNIGREGKIIGVVKDFHFSSLHDEIGPLILGIDKSNFYSLNVKISPDDVPGVLGLLEQKWSELRPGEEFRYRFFEDQLGREYMTEQRTSTILLYFTLITVFVACLGLFGLAAYGAQRRTNEIGVRKVLGSSEIGIVGLLTKEFITLVILANIFAAPVAYYLANRWLENFAYRVELGWMQFLLAGALTVIIALTTVCYQAIKAARTNPVDVLKYE